MLASAKTRLRLRPPGGPGGALTSAKNRLSPPDIVPLLSRGKHRSPRKGACFMEFASFLAGERWSDHPACTHPLLATAARLVNDYSSDAARQRLVGLIPSVVGLTSDDPRMDARIALRCATTALPVVAADRQRVLAVSVLVCDRMLAQLDGRPVGRREERSRLALAEVPHAAQWAEEFITEVPACPDGFYRHAAPSTVRYAIAGIARACVAEPDRILGELLRDLIDDCTALLTPAAATTPQRTQHLVQASGRAPS